MQNNLENLDYDVTEKEIMDAYKKIKEYQIKFMI